LENSGRKRRLKPNPETRPRATGGTALRVLLVSAGLLLSGFVSAGFADDKVQKSPTPGDLYRAFETVVFGSEFGGRKPRSEVLKWEQPLRVAIRSYDDVAIKHENDLTEIAFAQVPVKEMHFKIAQKHLQTLSGLANLQLEDYRDSGKEPNLTINFVAKIHMANPVLVYNQEVGARRLASQNGCYFVIWKDEQSRAIERAVVVANTDRDAVALSHCVLEEVIQSLGMPNDNNVKWPSIFSDHHQITELSDADRIILKTLYSPEIRSGMSKKDVMRRVSKILKALAAKNTGND
jgi:hypothetical protein